MCRFDLHLLTPSPQFLASCLPAWIPTLVPILALAICCQPAQSENWTDNTGNFQVDAQFIAFDGKILVLQKQAGNKIRIPARRLSDKSLALALKLAGASSSSATSSAAVDQPEIRPPQPVSSPGPEASTTVPSPLAEGTTPEAVAQTLLKAIETGNLAVMWSQLPPTYQTDVSEVIHTFGQNMDPEVWKLGIGIAQKAVKILQTQPNFIAQSPALSALPMDAKTITDNLDVPLKTLTLLLNSDLADLQKLQTLDLATFARGQGSEIAQHLSKLPTSMPDNLNPLTLGVDAETILKSAVGAKVKNIGQTANTATLQMTPKTGDVATLEMVLIEGKWIPTDLADAWDAQMAAAKTALLAMKPQLEANKMMIMLPLRMADGAANQILAVKSQEEFDRVVAEITKNAGMLLGPLMGQGNGPPAFGPSANLSDEGKQADSFDFGNGLDADFADTPLNEDTNLGDNADFGEADFEDTDVDDFGFEDNDRDAANNVDFGEEK